MTGSAIAIPLLGAGTANAADAGTWDKVAMCESGGVWSADNGNGLYGGLQFTQDRWEEYGGTEYAERADLASRAQQIEVAEKVFDAEGIMAWPSCAVISGLQAGDQETPDVDPGTGHDDVLDPLDEEHDKAAEKAEEKKAEQEKAEDAEQEKADEAEKSQDSEDADQKDEQDEQDGREKSAEADAGKAEQSEEPAPATGGKHRGPQADEDAEKAEQPAKAENERAGGKHASRDSRGGDDYTVQHGDSLWTIAADESVEGGWSALYDANKKQIGTDPDLIKPGQGLRLG